MSVRSFVLLVALVPGAARAAAPSLETIMARAQARSESLAALRARVEECREAVRQARGWDNPGLGVSVGASQAGVARGTAIETTVSQPLSFPGKRGWRVAVADAELDLARAEVRRGETGLAVSTLRLAWEFALRRRLAGLTTARQARLETVQGYLAGRLFPSPQRRAERQIVELRLRELAAAHLEADAAVASAASHLAFLAGEDEPGLSELTVPWVEGATRWDAGGWSVRLLDGNPDLAAQRAVVAAARAAAGLARREAWPDPTLFAVSSRNSADGSGMLGAGVEVALPFLNRNRAGHRRQLARLDAEEHRLDAIVRQVESEGAAARVELDAAQSQARLYSEAFLADLEAGVVEADREFQRGRLDLLVYLELDGQAADAARRGLEAQRQAVDRWSALCELAGVPDMAAALVEFLAGSGGGAR